MKPSPSLVPRLKREEGFSATAYWDDAPGGGPGHWSIGYGSTASGPDDTITEPEAERKLLEKLAGAENDYSIIFQKDPPDLTQARFDSILDMLYNLGLVRFGAFHFMIGAIREGRWLSASGHAQQSLWYRQVGNRAKQVVEEFRTGVGECDYAAPSSPASTDPANKDTHKGLIEVPDGKWGGLLVRLLGILRKLFLVRSNMHEGGMK